MAVPGRASAPETARRLRVALADGARTTVHVATHGLARTQVRVAVLAGQQPLEA